MAFVAVSLIDDGLYWYSAESERRKNNFQTAFGIKFSELETEEYYNNNLSPSVLKYAVNTFESNYFSKFIASKMLFKSAIKSLVAVIVLISAGWLIADKSILLVISQAIFSAYIVEDTVSLRFKQTDWTSFMIVFILCLLRMEFIRANKYRFCFYTVLNMRA